MESPNRQGTSQHASGAISKSPKKSPEKSEKRQTLDKAKQLFGARMTSKGKLQEIFVKSFPLKWANSSSRIFP